jgi:hypothetical protein
VYIRPELTSGGNSPKSSTKPLREQAGIVSAAASAALQQRRAALSLSLRADQQSACPSGMRSQTKRFLSSVTLAHQQH